MTNSSKPQIYFSIDYRSPPSGMGQIIDTSKPKMIGNKYNYILVDYGCDDREDPHYVETKYFHSEQAAQEGWAGPVIKEIIAFLREKGVTHVYDIEMSYEYEFECAFCEDNSCAHEQGFFTLDDWADILLD